MERNYPKILVTDKAARSLRSGHPWVYADEVLQADAACANGQIVDVTTRSGHWLGAGFYNSASKIRVRVLSRNANDRFDEAFWTRRIQYAVDYRRTVMGQDFDNCRLIFGESDGFPGLTVDRFGPILVAQVLSLGMELRKMQLFVLLLQALRAGGEQIDAIYERNDVKLRQKEGMEQGTGFVPLDGLQTDLDGHVTIRENGILYDVDYIHGQKTGFFLDQKYNRRAAAQLAPGKRVLDCFTHTGAFGLNCAAAGHPSSRWMCRRMRSRPRGTMRSSMVCRIVWSTSALMCLICSQSWRSKNVGYMTISSSIRRRSPRAARPWRMPSAATRRSTSKPCASCRAAAILPLARAHTS